jgi:hypothetical protein
VEIVSTAARTRGSVTLDELPWDGLRSVRLRRGRQADFVLQTHEGPSIVPLRQAPEGFIERIQALEGFDNAALVAGLARPVGEAEFICWRAPRRRRRAAG